MFMDPYAVLGISRDASEDEIKRAFKKLALQNHPDKNPGNEERFKEINTAYQVLSDPEKKRLYDTTGSLDPGGFPQGPDMGGFPFGDIFGHLFGGRHNAHPPPETIRIHLNIEDLVYGSTKMLEVGLAAKCDACQGKGSKNDQSNPFMRCTSCNGRGTTTMRMGPMTVQSHCNACRGQGQILDPQKACPSCNGRKTVHVKRRLDINVPMGVEHGTRHTISGQGSYSESLGRNKDIVIVFEWAIDSSKYAVDQGTGNVTTRVDISLSDVLCGFSKKVKVYRDDITIISKGYFDPSRKVTIPNMGIPIPEHQRPRGNLILEFNVVFPSRVSKEQQGGWWKIYGPPNLAHTSGPATFDVTQE